MCKIQVPDPETGPCSLPSLHFINKETKGPVSFSAKHSSMESDLHPGLSQVLQGFAPEQLER